MAYKFANQKQYLKSLTPRRILVIGSTGVGKSSLINLLLRENEIEVSDDALGCTFQCQDHQAIHDDTFYVLSDTVGLNEYNRGRVPHYEAVRQLLLFIQKHMTGFNLLLFVMRKGRITDEFQKNYQLFYELLFNENVSCILYVSQCEEYSPMNQWITRETNAAEFRKYKFKEIICGTTMNNTVLEAKRKETNDHLWESIKQHQMEKPQCIQPDLNILQRIINFVLKFLTNNVYFEPHPLNEKGIDRCFRQMGFSDTQRGELMKLIEKPEPMPPDEIDGTDVLSNIVSNKRETE